MECKRGWGEDLSEEAVAVMRDLGWFEPHQVLRGQAIGVMRDPESGEPVLRLLGSEEFNKIGWACLEVSDWLRNRAKEVSDE